MSDTPRVAVRDLHFFVHELHTRFPFRYGIAHMTELPHLFVRADLEVDGRAATGLAAEHLPPKWFTKDPTTTFEEDLPALVAVVRHAAQAARAIGQAPSFFAFWQELYRAQHAWAMAEGYPPLLANLGVSLVERVVLDGLCRGLDTTLHDAARAGVLGLDLGAVHGPHAGAPVAGPESSSGQVPLVENLPGALAVRHTVGMGDPLTPDDIDPEEAAHDGLPHALTRCIETYGLTYFKVKVGGNLEADTERLLRLARVLDEACGENYRFTLDGNEQYASMAEFRAHWEAWMAEPEIRAMRRRLLFVEQPVHRRSALDDTVGPELAAWTDAPPFIIDESDATLDSLPQALRLGYAGTSHKNCKGIVKGIANAALLARRRAEQPEARTILSGEDLSNVGPVALLQDLTVMAMLGIAHVERNGHHYFRGLSMFPAPMQDAVLAHHADLYTRHPDGYPTLAVTGGLVRIESLAAAPFGVAPLIDPTGCTPLDAYMAQR